MSAPKADIIQRLTRLVEELTNTARALESYADDGGPWPAELESHAVDLDGAALIVSTWIAGLEEQL